MDYFLRQNLMNFHAKWWFILYYIYVYIIQIDSYVKIFPKVGHGWTVRYDFEDEAAVKTAEEAHKNLLEWFSKHVQ